MHFYIVQKAKSMNKVEIFYFYVQAADSLNTDKEAAGEDRIERTNTNKVIQRCATTNYRPNKIVVGFRFHFAQPSKIQ